ncbi:hypothetical protein PYCC9005_002051 [Savitreella phatthalungensis]
MAERPALATRLSRKLTAPTSRPSLSHRRSNSAALFDEEVVPRRNRIIINRGQSTLRHAHTMPIESSDNERRPLLDSSAGRQPTGTTSNANDNDNDNAYDDDDKPDPRSFYDKKSDLVTAELNRIGFGRYQWGLFVVCGSGWVLDLLWAQAFGLALPAIQKELKFSEKQYGYLSTGFSIGLTLGALTWGILLDTLGRKPAFNYTVAISSAFGLLTGFVSSYPLLILLATGVGFGVGGNIPVDTTIFLEFIPQNRRNMLVVMSIFQPVGTIFATVLAWALIPQNSCKTEACPSEDNRGWRYLFYTVSAITIFIFIIRFVLFDMLESPAFLLSQNRDEEVVEVLAKVADRNGVSSNISVDELTSQKTDREHEEANDADEDDESSPQGVLQKHFSKFDISHLRLLFKSSRTARLTILTWLIYAADFWGFTLAGVFLPKILLAKGARNKLSVEETYLEYIAITLAGLPGAIVSMVIVQRKGRRRITMAISSILMAGSLFAFATVNSQAGNIAFNAVEYFCQTVFNAILYAWTPEVFEPSVRGAAAGISAFWGRLISIIAPIIGGAIYAAGPNGGNNVLFSAGGGTLVATLCIMLLP